MIRCNFYLYDVHYDERLRKLLSSLYARMLCNIVIFLVGSWSEFSSLFHYSRSCRILKKLILHSNFCLCSWAPQVFLNNTWTQSVLWTFSEYFMYTDDTIHKISSAAQKWENDIQNFQFYVFNNAAVRLHAISFDNKIFQMSLTILY